MNRAHVPLVAATLLSTLAAARADETVLQEVIVTAALDRQLLEVAQPASVLSGDDLLRQRAASLGATLSRQPGVSSSYFGTTVDRPVIRGLGGYRIQTLQDGLATLDLGSLSDDHAVTIDPALAEQIEIIKGPATLLYGSAAAAGLINVVTPRIPADRPANGARGLLEVRGDTATQGRAAVGALDFGSQRVAIHVDAFGSASDTLEIPGARFSTRLRARIAAAGGEVDTQAGRIPNAFHDTRGGALGLAWSDNSLHTGIAASRHETQYGIPAEEHAFIDLQQNRYSGTVEWAGQGWLRAVQLSGAVNDYEHTEFEAPGEPETTFTQAAYEWRATLSHAQGARWRGTVGAQFTRLDLATAGSEAFVPPSVTESLGIFALEEFVADTATVTLGARFESQKIVPDADRGLPTFSDGAVTGAAGVIVRLGATQTLAINATHSARHPQATELYANGAHVAAQRFELGNAALDTERSNTLDIALRHHHDRWSGSLGVFYNDYDNFVFAAPTGNITEGLGEVQYTQAAARLYGFELEAWLPLTALDPVDVRLGIFSDYTRGERTSGEPLPQMPPLRVGLGIHLDHKGWHAQIEGTYHARQPRVATNELPTDGYWLLTADFSHRLKTNVGEWFVFLRGSNLLDREARVHTSSLKDVLPLPGRALSVGVRWSFE